MRSRPPAFPFLPMHASIFQPAAEALRPSLLRAPFRAPRLPYLPNVLGRFEESPSPVLTEKLLFRRNPIALEGMSPAAV